MNRQVNYNKEDPNLEGRRSNKYKPEHWLSNYTNKQHSNFNQTNRSFPIRPVFPQGRGKRPYTITSAQVFQTQAESSSPKRYFRQQTKPTVVHQHSVDSCESPAKSIQKIKNQEWEKELFPLAVQRLNESSDGNEVAVLLDVLQLKRNEWNEATRLVLNDLYNLIRPFHPKNILLFGSCLTGLDFKGSDLDYYIELCEPFEDEVEIRRLLSRVNKSVRSTHNAFHVMYTIQNAKVPVIRILHQPTNILCDVNFSSPFGYFNSIFVGQILAFDKRIKELGIILKLWSKSHKLAEKMMLSNYCLIMILFFYLQNLERPMLNSIKQTQFGQTPKIVNSKLKWNFFFNESINKSSNCQLTLRQLLEGFYEFFHKFNYSKYIVSLYNADLIEKKDFDNHPDFEMYRFLIKESGLPQLKIDQECSLIVQDGFELNRNIGTKCKKHTDYFFELIKASHEKCLKMKSQPMSALLVSLVTDLKVPECVAESKSEKKSKKKFLMTVHSNAGDLKICQDILITKEKNKICSIEDQQKYFFYNVCNGVIRFLKEIYLCSVINGSHAENSFYQEIKCLLSLDTITGRKKINFKNELTLQSEKELSVKMLEKNIPLELDIIIKFTSNDKGKSINIEMIDNNPVQKKSPLLSFGNFFAVNIAPASKYYLKETYKEIIQSANS